MLERGRWSHCSNKRAKCALRENLGLHTMYLKFLKDQESRSKKNKKLGKRPGETRKRKRTKENIQLKSTQTWLQRKNKDLNETEVQIMN